MAEYGTLHQEIEKALARGASPEELRHFPEDYWQAIAAPQLVSQGFGTEEIAKLKFSYTADSDYYVDKALQGKNRQEIRNELQMDSKGNVPDRSSAGWLGLLKDPVGVLQPNSASSPMTSAGLLDPEQIINAGMLRKPLGSMIKKITPMLPFVGRLPEAVAKMADTRLGMGDKTAPLYQQVGPGAGKYPFRGSNMFNEAVDQGASAALKPMGPNAPPPNVIGAIRDFFAARPAAAPPAAAPPKYDLSNMRSNESPPSGWDQLLSMRGGPMGRPLSTLPGLPGTILPRPPLALPPATPGAQPFVARPNTIPLGPPNQFDVVNMPPNIRQMLESYFNRATSGVPPTGGSVVRELLP